MKYLYIDDIRNPGTNKDWIIVRSSHEAILWLNENGCPDYISFDHDLGGDDTSMKIVKFMVNQDLNFPGWIPLDFKYNVHSANPVGASNIDGYLKSYFKQKDKNEIKN